MSEIVSAIQSAVQVTIARRIGASLAIYIADPDKRALVAVAACVILHISPMRTALALDICMVVTASTVLGVLVHGFDTAATMSHACMFLIMCEKLGSHGMPDSFVSNAQFLFADAVTNAVVSSPLHKIFAAVAIWGASFALKPISPLLGSGLLMAGVGILKSILVQAIPTALKLPTVLSIMSFAKPLSTPDLLGPQLYNFALYLAADSLQQSLHPPHVAFFVCALLYLAAPTRAYEAMAQIACVGVTTDIVIAAVQHIAAKADPLPAFISMLVMTRITVSTIQRLKLIA